MPCEAQPSFKGDSIQIAYGQVLLFCHISRSKWLLDRAGLRRLALTACWQWGRLTLLEHSFCGCLALPQSQGETFLGEENASLKKNRAVRWSVYWGGVGALRFMLSKAPCLPCRKRTPDVQALYF